MKLTRHRRISGKARQAYYRQRELRRQARKRVDEYFRGDEAYSTRERHVPVVHGSPVLAQVGAGATVASSLVGDERLPGVYAAPPTRGDATRHPARGPAATRAQAVFDDNGGFRYDSRLRGERVLAGVDVPFHLVAESAPVAASLEPDKSAPVLAKLPTRGREGKANLWPSSSRPVGVRLADVLLGCAAGTAAAAVILVLVKTLLG